MYSFSLQQECTGNAGILLNSIDSLYEWTVGADAVGLQGKLEPMPKIIADFPTVSIHAIGDRANHLLLDMFEKVIQTNGPKDRRFRIEHAQHIRYMPLPGFLSVIVHEGRRI